MPEDRIKRKDLWIKLGNIKKLKTWSKAADDLGLLVTQPKGGTSHFAIRKPGFDKSDIRGFITTIYDHMRKDINEKVFKALLDCGYDEDRIWVALGLLDPDKR